MKEKPDAKPCLCQKNRQVSGLFTRRREKKMESFESLKKRDEQREADGFPKKIRYRRALVGKKIISVPYVEEEKLIHGEFGPADASPDEDGNEKNEGELGDLTGQGKGEVGDVIGKRPLEGGGEGDSSEAGDEPGEHGIEGEISKVGQELTERFKLPNLKDKGKKVPTTKYTYDLTDRHRGSGQVLDKKATLRSIVRTNVMLGRCDAANPDTSNFVIGPDDKIYRVLSRERVWESQAVVFFLRDYSGSMLGDPTRAVVAQHLIIYAWLTAQYEKLVVPRFIVHDTEAKEVLADEYYRASINGGTKIASGYQKIIEIVKAEGLERAYNIYVFQGTDGEDFDTVGQEALPELREMLSFVNRAGVCVLKSPYMGDRDSVFEGYVKTGGILEKKDLFRMHVMPSQNVTEDKNIEAVKALIAQD